MKELPVANEKPSKPEDLYTSYPGKYLGFIVTNVDLKRNRIGFQIYNQMFRGENFGSYCSFVSRDGFKLYSSAYPEVSAIENKKIFVCGSSGNKDDYQLEANTETFNQFRRAVAEYNAECELKGK